LKGGNSHLAKNFPAIGGIHRGFIYDPVISVLKTSDRAVRAVAQRAGADTKAGISLNLDTIPFEKLFKGVVYPDHLEIAANDAYGIGDRVEYLIQIRVTGP
jgi:hypothetical protein